MLSLIEPRRMLVTILALGLFAMAVRSATDPDMWWHLRTGELIVQSHIIPHTDPYSFTRAGKPWVDHEWLSQIVMYGLYRFAGWAGLIAAFALVVAASMMIVFARCSEYPLAAALFSAWGAAASVPSWGVRPQMLSLLLASILLWLLERYRDKPSLIWWTIPLMLVWVNVHAGYALGIAFLMLFIAGNLCERAFSNRSSESARLLPVVLATVACVLIVPLNPNGTRIYGYPFETLSSHAMQTYISEWFSPDFHQTMYLPFEGLVLAVVAAFAVSRRRVPAHQLLWMAAATWGALRSVRHIPIFVLVAVPIVSRIVGEWLRSRRSYALRRAPAKPQVRQAKLVLNAITLLAMAAFTGARLYSVVRQQHKMEAERFPAEAVSYLNDHHLPGPILNHYNWGGYLIWRCWPEYRVFIDGRADVYGDEQMDQFADTYNLRHDWQKPFREWGIQTVLVPPDAPLVAGLRASGGWTAVYSGPDAIVLFRGTDGP